MSFTMSMQSAAGTLRSLSQKSHHTPVESITDPCPKHPYGDDVELSNVGCVDSEVLNLRKRTRQLEDDLEEELIRSRKMAKEMKEMMDAVSSFSRDFQMLTQQVRDLEQMTSSCSMKRMERVCGSGTASASASRPLSGSASASRPLSGSAQSSSKFVMEIDRTTSLADMDEYLRSYGMGVDIEAILAEHEKAGKKFMKTKSESCLDGYVKTLRSCRGNHERKILLNHQIDEGMFKVRELNDINHRLSNLKYINILFACGSRVPVTTFHPLEDTTAPHLRKVSEHLRPTQYRPMRLLTFQPTSIATAMKALSPGGVDGIDMDEEMILGTDGYMYKKLTRPMSSEHLWVNMGTWKESSEDTVLVTWHMDHGKKCIYRTQPWTAPTQSPVFQYNYN